MACMILQTSLQFLVNKISICTITCSIVIRGTKGGYLKKSREEYNILVGWN